MNLDYVPPGWDGTVQEVFDSARDSIEALRTILKWRSDIDPKAFGDEVQHEINNIAGRLTNLIDVIHMALPPASKSQAKRVGLMSTAQEWQVSKACRAGHPELCELKSCSADHSKKPG